MRGHAVQLLWGQGSAVSSASVKMQTQEAETPAPPFPGNRSWGLSGGGAKPAESPHSASASGLSWGIPWALGGLGPP